MEGEKESPSLEALPRGKIGLKSREKEMSRKERWRRVDMSGSLRGRRSEEMTQLNASSLQGLEVLFESQRG